VAKERAEGPAGRIIGLALFAGASIGLFLLFLSVQVARGFDETAALRAEVVRSYETRAALQRVLSLHQDLETGQRGYVVTGDRRFLEPYEGAAAKIDEAMPLLERRLLAGSDLRGDLDRLQLVSLAKRRFSRRMVALAEQGRLDEARREIAAGDGKSSMDELRRSVQRIDEHERAQLEAQTARADAAQRQLITRGIALQATLLVILAIALGFLVRAYRGWQATFRRERDLTARQEAIFEAATDAMIVLNESGSIESLNPAASRIFGYEPDELPRRDVGLLFEVAPDRGRVETFLRRLAARGSGQAAQTQEMMGRCKDGSLFPAEVSVSPVQLAGGLRFLAVLRDVTRRKQVEQMKTEFVSTVSHELRTPLTSISGSLGLLTGGAAGELPGRALRLVEIARSNCARLIRLINDILDIEKIESGRMAFDIRPLPLSRLLEQAVQDNRAFAAEHGAMIHLDQVPPGAAVLGDEDRVMQVLTNLISNAAKFSPEGGVVELTVTPLDRRFRISVADQGPGIPDGFKDRIFSKFAQADASDTRQKGGTGLGLSIVREIVTRLGGSVSFDSEAGRGTTFQVDLPAAPDSMEPHAEPASLGRIGAGDMPVVLHVDDDPDMLRVVASTLEGRAQVHSTPSVIEARASLMRYEFDTVILDIGMADGDGLELIPLIRERQQARIIVFTAQEADPARLEGSDAVLIKSRDSLNRLVDEVVAASRKESP
jgi:PAS domain S-box-containing protein